MSLGSHSQPDPAQLFTDPTANADSLLESLKARFETMNQELAEGIIEDII